MSKRERKRLEVMSQVKLGVMTLAKGSELLELSYRQAKRLWARYEAEGDGGLVHRLWGRSSNRLGVAAFREQVLARYVEQYGDYGRSCNTSLTGCIQSWGAEPLPTTADHFSVRNPL